MLNLFENSVELILIYLELEKNELSEPETRYFKENFRMLLLFTLKAYNFIRISAVKFRTTVAKNKIYILQFEIVF